MSKNIHQAFKSLSQPQPSVGLETRILERIALEQAKQLKRKLAFVYAGLASSVAVFFLAVYEFGAAFWHSDFWSLVKLLFSDLGIVAEHWSEFAYSLLETFPVIEMIVLLLPIFALLWCLASYFNATKDTSNHFINGRALRLF